jgi:serine/threonine protein kinase
VRAPDGQIVQLKVSSTDTVAGVRERVAAQLGLQGWAAGQCRLIFAGRELDESCRLGDYNVANESELHIVLRVVEEARPLELDMEALMAEIDQLSAALAGSKLKDFNVRRKIGGKDVTPGAMSATVTMHGVCSYVYSVVSRRPAAAGAGELAMKVMLNMHGDQTGALHEQFRGEHELLRDGARLPRHPNISPVLHVFDDLATAARLPGFDFDPRDVMARTTFVVMPCFDKGDLRAAMKRAFGNGEYFPEGRVRELLTQLLRAVAHLKQHRIVHRDIKDDNVMISSVPNQPGRERLVLIDFGQCLDCRQFELEEFKMPMPVHMSRGGAPGFLAPEVVLPAPGPRTFIDYSLNDDWAVGMLLHILLSGPAYANPFSSGEDPRRFVDGDYTPPDLSGGGYSEALGEIARGLLTVDPAARMDVGTALARLVQPAPPPLLIQAQP